MRKIVLASRSQARRRLLSEIGLTFTTADANVEELASLKKGCSALVISNAIRKAAAVAGRLKSGVVIGADTVVLVGRRIIGKPKDRKDALRTLRLLSRKAQWVYTGIAVIDIDAKKTFSTYDKTKVYMLPLTDRQIRHYVRRVSVLDKAGSFDIQGLGGLLIDRIEGCYYNVVGLPLAKLGMLLERAKVDLFRPDR